MFDACLVLPYPVTHAHAFLLMSLSQLAKSFDTFFSWAAKKKSNGNVKHNISVCNSIDIISEAIKVSIDSDGLSQLIELIPSLSRVVGADAFQMRDMDDCLNVTSSSVMGSSQKRLQHLFHLLVKAMCCCVCPVLIVLEDMQWVSDHTLKVIGSFVETKEEPSALPSVMDCCNGGLFLLSSYRDDEVPADGELMKQIERLNNVGGQVNVAKLFIEELTPQDLNDIFSSNLCLPKRYTRPLSNIVHQKTQGNPMYVKEMLQSLIDNSLLKFSLKTRRWTWDEDVIEIQMISNGVAELITKKLRRLPGGMVATLKLMSCLGSQVKASMMRVFNPEESKFDVIGHLDEAVREGLLERADSIYAFSHDLVKQAVQDLMPPSQQELIHKQVGMMIIKHPNSCHGEFLQIALDQINMCEINGDTLERRADFAQLNLTAAKNSWHASCFTEARSYLETGISLLNSNNWESQYTLSLELHDTLSVVCFLDGDVETMAKHMQIVLSKATSFDDSLNARALLVKYLGASGKHPEAIATSLETLTQLGEEFPIEIELTDVARKLRHIRGELTSVSKEWFLSLPRMTKETKLNAMKFMSTMFNYVIVGNQLLSAIIR